MKNKKFLAVRPVQLSLFFIFFFLFIWPFLAAPSVAQPEELFLYLFSAWGFVLLFAFLISRACRDEPGPSDEQSGRDG